MNIDYSDLTQILASYQTLLVAGVLLARPALRLLAMFTLTFAMHLISSLAFNLFWLPNLPNPAAILSLLYGPLLYLSVRQLTFDLGPFRVSDLAHVLVVLVIAFALPEGLARRLAGAGIFAVYLVLSYQLTLDHRKAMSEVRSDDDIVRLDWLGWIVLGFCTLLLLEAIRFFGQANIGEFTNEALSGSLYLALAGLFTLLGWKSWLHVRHDGVAAEPPLPGSDEQLNVQLFESIDELVREEKLWLQPGLSVNDIALRLSVAPRDISRAINVHTASNFSTYINGFRVVEVDRLMAQPENHDSTLLDLAFDAGFNSKAAFNRIYRQSTGRTPGESFRRLKSS